MVEGLSGDLGLGICGNGMGGVGVEGGRGGSV